MNSEPPKMLEVMALWKSRALMSGLACQQLIYQAIGIPRENTRAIDEVHSDVKGLTIESSLRGFVNLSTLHRKLKHTSSSSSRCVEGPWIQHISIAGSMLEGINGVNV